MWNRSGIKIGIPLTMTEIRCIKCNRLLMKAVMVHAEVKCGKCGFTNVIRRYFNRQKEIVPGKVYRQITN